MLAATATVTAAVLPFIQSLATQAGLRAFETARSMVRRFTARTIGVNGLDQYRIVVRDTETGVEFIMPQGLPDEALSALTTTDLEALAMPLTDGSKVMITWDAEAQQWQRRTDT
ncbi:hypothetical protein [Streptomyces sp. NPDC052693]|uniref:hypothetical protein n=1 Tax=Streptomyces sp. NPDC052693 TaxID=3155814 RepID=UPI003415EF1C